MRRVLFFVAAGLAFAVLPFTPRLGPVLGSVALVALSVAFALAASGTASALSVAGGALGAFAFGMLGATSHGVAGALLVGLCFGERTLRVRGQTARLLHIGAALGAGALAGSLSMAFALSPLPVRAVAVTVTAVLLALPLLVAADDPLAHALELASLDLDGPVAASLAEAAELRRVADEDLLDPGTSGEVRRTWAALLRLSEARGRLARGRGAKSSAVVARVDQRITDHVTALERAYTAASAAKAAEVTLHDAPLRGTETAGESLEAMTRAMVEDA